MSKNAQAEYRAKFCLSFVEAPPFFERSSKIDERGQKSLCLFHILVLVICVNKYFFSLLTRGYFPCEYCLFESIDHLRPLKIFYIMCSQVIYLSGLEGDAATFRYWLIITILIV